MLLLQAVKLSPPATVKTQKQFGDLFKLLQEGHRSQAIMYNTKLVTINGAG